jgi:hypothetical protein
MPKTAAEDTKKLQIFVDVVDKTDIHIPVYSTPPEVNADDIDCIVVSLNKANPGVAKALEKSDTDEIIRLVNFTLIHDMTSWQHHYPLHRIREHVWKEAGKTDEEMGSLPGFFDIAHKPSPFLQAVTKLPINGDKAELAQYDGQHLIAEIDINETETEIALRLAQQRLAALTAAAPEKVRAKKA